MKTVDEVEAHFQAVKLSFTDLKFNYTPGRNAR